MSRHVLCEVVAVDARTGCCREGDTHVIDLKSCPPMCPKLFHAAFPSAYVYLSTQTGPGPQQIEVTCPDGLVTVRLKRLVERRCEEGLSNG